MAEFHDIDSDQFKEKANPTGGEKIQISAVEYVTLQQIANLYKEKGVEVFYPVKIQDSNLASGTSLKDNFWNLNQVTDIEAIVAKANEGGLVPIALQCNTGSGSSLVKTLTGYMVRVNEGNNPSYRITVINVPGTNPEEAEVINIVISGNTTTVGSDWDVYFYRVVQKEPEIPEIPKVNLEGFTYKPLQSIDWLNLKEEDTLVDVVEKLTFLNSKNMAAVIVSDNVSSPLISVLYVDYEADYVGGIQFDLKKGKDNSTPNILFFNTFDNNITLSSLVGKSDKEINAVVKSNGKAYDLATADSVMSALNLKLVASQSSLTIGGGDTIHVSSTIPTNISCILLGFSKNKPTAVITMPYQVSCTFSLFSGGTRNIYLQSDISSLNPTSGRKVYTIMYVPGGDIECYYINCALYD